MNEKNNFNSDSERIKIEPTGKIVLDNNSNDLESLEKLYQTYSRDELGYIINTETDLAKIKIAKKVLKSK